MNTRLIDLINSTSSPRITVVGDIILDTYIHGHTNRISPEAPIQVIDIIEEKKALGGAANVAMNLRNLDAHVELAGVIGDDAQGVVLREMLNDSKIGTSAVMVEAGRPTVSKTRVVAQNQQLVRIDKEVRDALKHETEERLFESLAPLLDKSDIVVLSDYAKGVISTRLVKRINGLAGGKVLVDPKGREFSRYRGCRLITPNRKEAEESTGIALRSEEDLLRAAGIIFDEVDAQEVVITLGAKGIFYAWNRRDSNMIPAESRSVYDVTGAGDTVISLLAFSLAAGIDLDDAVRIANAGAGIVVGKLGVAAPTRVELKEFFGSGSTRYIDKIISVSNAAELAGSIGRKGEKLVFTNGCFDLVHGGHVDFLRAAKNMGDYLLVAVNSDASIKKLKGPERPVIPLQERMEVLASFQMVDFVVSFSEETPLNVITSITPHVLVKGEDWKDKGVVGREWVEDHGGTVTLLPLKEGLSTSGVIERILERYGKEVK